MLKLNYFLEDVVPKQQLNSGEAVFEFFGNGLAFSNGDVRTINYINLARIYSRFISVKLKNFIGMENL